MSTAIATEEVQVRVSPFGTFVIDTTDYRFSIIDVDAKRDRETLEPQIQERTDYLTKEVTRTSKWVLTVSAIEPDGSMNAVKVQIVTNDTSVMASLAAGDAVEFGNLRAKFWDMRTDEGQRKTGYSVSADAVRKAVNTRKVLSGAALFGKPLAAAKPISAAPASPKVDEAGKTAVKADA